MDSGRVCRCGTAISQERLDILPNTYSCVRCSTEQPYVGMMSYSHKTAPALIYTRPENKEAVEALQRAYRRARR